RFLDKLGMQAADFSDDQIAEATTLDGGNNAEILAEAAGENQKLFTDEEKVKPNPGATVAHIRKHVDFAEKNEMGKDAHDRIIAHAQSEMLIAQKNEMRRIQAMGAMLPPPEMVMAGGGGAAPTATPETVPAPSKAAQTFQRQGL
ncbi:MAG: hypothetical protein PHI63_06735, partial [Patescibacteria group bacterium]|nr:hypothetical protein [Patescibacteria group bacterium]